MVGCSKKAQGTYCQGRQTFKQTLEPGGASRLSRELLCGRVEKVQYLPWTLRRAPDRACRMWVDYDGEDILESGWRGSRQFLATWRCSTVRNRVDVLTAVPFVHSNIGQEATWGRRVYFGSQSEGIPFGAMAIASRGSWSHCLTLRKRVTGGRSRLGHSLQGLSSKDVPLAGTHLLIVLPPPQTLPSAGDQGLKRMRLRKTFKSEYWRQWRKRLFRVQRH